MVKVLENAETSIDVGTVTDQLMRLDALVNASEQMVWNSQALQKKDECGYAVYELLKMARRELDVLLARLDG